MFNISILFSRNNVSYWVVVQRQFSSALQPYDETVLIPCKNYDTSTGQQAEAKNLETYYSRIHMRTHLLYNIFKQGSIVIYQFIFAYFIFSCCSPYTRIRSKINSLHFHVKLKHYKCRNKVFSPLQRGNGLFPLVSEMFRRNICLY